MDNVKNSAVPALGRLSQFARLLSALVLLSLTALLGTTSIPFLVHDVRAPHDGDDWAPLGPHVNTVVMSSFGKSKDNELTALQQGSLDLTDWPVPSSSLTTTCTNPNLHCEFYSGLDMYGVDFNHNPRNKWFGVISGADEQAITEILRAIAHMLDKDQHIDIGLGGLGSRLDAVLPGFPDLWAQPFDSLHQGPQTVKYASDDPLVTNAILVKVVYPDQTPKPNVDVFLIHITGDKSKEGTLGSYAAICRDGVRCATVAPAVKHPGVDGIPDTLDDEFNFAYQSYSDAKDGIVSFKSNTDAKTGVEIPLPTTGSYIVYAVSKETSQFGWGHLTPPFDTITVLAGNALPAYGWYNNIAYPPGSSEYCEARDHLVQIHADINSDGVPDTPFKDADNDCRIDTSSAIFSAPGFRPLRFYVHSSAALQNMAGRLFLSFHLLFNTNPSMIIITLSKEQIKTIVDLGSPVDDWDLHTMKWILGRDGRDFDHIDKLYNMQYAYAPCGTVPDNRFTTNYGSFCNHLFSSAARAARNTFDPVAAKLATFLHNFAVGSIPVWATNGYKAYHNAWTGAVDQIGQGTNNYYNLLNMYAKKDCTLNSKLVFTDGNGNGCWDFGEPLTLRYGLLESPQQLNPLQSNPQSMYWDFLVLNQIYDTLQNFNPYQLQEDYTSMASSWRNFVNPTAAQLGYEPPTGTALTQRWLVKNHLGWAPDSKPITGKDVAFSILAYKEVGSPLFRPVVEPINYVRLVSEVPYQIVVDVGMNYDAPQFQAGHVVGILPVIPCNVYSTGNPGLQDLPNCGGISVGVTMAARENGIFSGASRDPNFDPTFVPDEDGDGIPESDCADRPPHRTGHKGTGPYIMECTTSGVSAPPPLYETIILQSHVVSKSQFAKSREYWASPHNYLVWRWADFNNNGAVGTDDKARTRLNPPLGCRNKPVPTDQNQWDQNGDGLPDDNCIQFDFNRNGVSSDFSDRARMTLEGDKRWTHNKATDVGTPNPSTTGACRWPWPGPTNCSGQVQPGYRTVIYPWVGWVWWLQHQCLGPDNSKNTADDDKNACWFTKFPSRPA